IVIHKSWQFSALTQCGALQVDANLVLTCRQGLQVRSMGNPDKPGKSAETESMAFALSDNLIIHKGFRLVYNDEGPGAGRSCHSRCCGTSLAVACPWSGPFWAAFGA